MSIYSPRSISWSNETEKLSSPHHPLSTRNIVASLSTTYYLLSRLQAFNHLIHNLFVRLITSYQHYSTLRAIKSISRASMFGSFECLAMRYFDKDFCNKTHERVTFRNGPVQTVIIVSSSRAIYRGIITI
jgi:hypothetical protein